MAERQRPNQAPNEMNANSIAEILKHNAADAHKASTMTLAKGAIDQSAA
jgi:hypothetical protein